MQSKNYSRTGDPPGIPEPGGHQLPRAEAQINLDFCRVPPLTDHHSGAAQLCALETPLLSRPT